MAATKTCASCKAAEGKKLGAAFEAFAASGKKVSLWLCNDCAIDLGPTQGPILLKNPNER